ncbi:hypothetical protein P167DRAFT_578747, partial [Morchella conica CCBAS932]
GFRATNRKVLWAEANTPPLDLYLHYLKCKYAIRILRSSPLGNPVTGRTSPSFPTISTHRTYSHTQLLKGLPNPPKKWNSTAIKGVAHLPIELLASLLLPLIEGGIAPARMNLHAKTQLLANWKHFYPPPEYYPHPLSTTPLPFNDLHKFIATRIHQFRSGKSYLRAQKTWMTAHLSSKCERCNAAEETPEHAILHCPALAPNRHGPLQTITSLNDIWNDQNLTIALGAFIAVTKTGYPRSAPPSPLATGSTTMSTLTSIPTTSSSYPLAGSIPTIYAS